MKNCLSVSRKCIMESISPLRLHIPCDFLSILSASCSNITEDVLPYLREPSKSSLSLSITYLVTPHQAPSIDNPASSGNFSQFSESAAPFNDILRSFFSHFVHRWDVLGVLSVHFV